jgi:hypothetical protein
MHLVARIGFGYHQRAKIYRKRAFHDPTDSRDGLIAKQLTRARRFPSISSQPRLREPAQDGARVFNELSRRCRGRFCVNVYPGATPVCLGP